MGFTNLPQLIRDVDAKVQSDRKAYPEEMLPRVITMCSHIDVAIEEARVQDAARTRYIRAASAAQAAQPSLEARPPAGALEDAQQQQVPPSRFGEHAVALTPSCEVVGLSLVPARRSLRRRRPGALRPSAVLPASETLAAPVAREEQSWTGD